MLAGSSQHVFPFAFHNMCHQDHDYQHRLAVQALHCPLLMAHMSQFDAQRLGYCDANECSASALSPSRINTSLVANAAIRVSCSLRRRAMPFRHRRDTVEDDHLHAKGSVVSRSGFAERGRFISLNPEPPNPESGFFLCDIQTREQKIPPNRQCHYIQFSKIGACVIQRGRSTNEKRDQPYST